MITSRKQSEQINIDFNFYEEGLTYDDEEDEINNQMAQDTIYDEDDEEDMINKMNNQSKRQSIAGSQAQSI